MNPLPLPSAVWTRLALLIGVGACVVSWFGWSWELPSRLLFEGQTEGTGRFAALLFAVLLTILWYFVLSHWASRTFGPTQAGSSDKLVQQFVQSLAQRVGVRPIHVRLSRDHQIQDALVCRHWGRRTLLLGGRMRLLMRKRPDLFEAVVLHELGHLSSSDVDTGYLARATIFSVGSIGFLSVVASLVPLVDPQAREDWSYFHLPYFLWTVVQVLLFVMVAYVEYAAVLRSREHYADLTSVRHGARPQFLRTETRSFWSTLRHVVRHHPNDMVRAKIVQRPELVMTLSGLELVWLGYLLGLSFDLAKVTSEQLTRFGNAYDSRSLDVPKQLQRIASEIPLEAATTIFIVLFVGYSAIAVLGGILARWSFEVEYHRRSKGHSAQDVIRFVLVLGFGSILGYIFNPLLISRLFIWPSDSVLEWLVNSVSSSWGFFLGLFVLVATIAVIGRFAARIVIRRHSQSPPRSWLYFLVFLFAAFVGAQVGQGMIFLVAFANQLIVDGTTLKLPREMLIWVAAYPSVLLFVCLILWLVFRQTRVTSFPAWLIWDRQ